MSDKIITSPRFRWRDRLAQPDEKSFAGKSATSDHGVAPLNYHSPAPPSSFRLFAQTRPSLLLGKSSSSLRTISVNNTILNFAEAVYAATPSNKQTLPPLASLLAEYEANITRASEEYGPQDTIAEEVAFESSRLRRNVDVTLFDRVAASGMIGHLNTSVLPAAAETVVFRPDFWEWAVAASRCGAITVSGFLSLSLNLHGR
ncbi:hypothetical protein M409DRAFT_29998 [Zasmidium cellare ATCC 36951]|uniref:Uncharacterized protein n=1 Tax=Zasmidium cellare ATCC 36951 TaxID=1080233 RepID=A0A6A6BY50_ZASCE|nr:uncharacterized protein M409DRAFT_29998 [Zasmidium cellare ATCC 36951]KAF2159523.1 hypothetical protein M409DRAFT_29998 [Zasmidium cellare ATCC 36951]